MIGFQKESVPAAGSHIFLSFFIQFSIWALAAITEKDLCYIHLPSESKHIL